MKPEDMNDNQRKVFFQLATLEQRNDYLFVIDTANCASSRILVANRLPRFALEQTDSGVCRAVLKAGGGQ